MSGIHLVTVPIGNALDITQRALDTLKTTQIIYCEDTRMFKDLCRKIGVEFSDKKINSFHDHSDEKKLLKIVEEAREESIVFLSDAGSPIISDPAYPLVKTAYENGVEVHSISGISAITAALELSALPPIPFQFHGFLARDNSKKQASYEHIRSTQGTHIYFEGVARVLDTLEEMSSELPDLDFVVCREITKEFESVYRFKGSEFKAIKDEIFNKGEFVILVHNPNKQSGGAGKEVLKLANQILDKGAKPKTVAKLLAEITGGNSKEIYQKIGR